MNELEFGKGAVVTDKLEELNHNSDVAMDTAPFDWNLGYDVTQVIKTDLLTKNQGQAGSCGGEASSYKCEVVHYLNTSIYEPKSSRYIYGQCYVPGGGSSDAGLINILTNLGTPDTSVFSDYPVTSPAYPDGLPTEAWMDNVSDITVDINHNASACVLGQPVYVSLDFDSIAKAIRDTGGIIIGIYGQNNGTWLSEYPQAPTTKVGAWAHWLYVGKAKMITGKEFIGFKNSWGSQVGDNGWQWIGVDYLPYIWRAFTFVNTGIGDEFKHTFDTTKAYKLNDNSPEVKLLQKALKLAGTYPIGQACTGYFGNITQKAVNDFQLKYKYDIMIPANIKTPSGIAGKYTLTKINQFLAS